MSTCNDKKFIIASIFLYLNILSLKFCYFQEGKEQGGGGVKNKVRSSHIVTSAKTSTKPVILSKNISQTQTSLARGPRILEPILPV